MSDFNPLTQCVGDMYHTVPVCVAMREQSFSDSIYSPANARQKMKDWQPIANAVAPDLDGALDVVQKIEQGNYIGAMASGIGVIAGSTGPGKVFSRAKVEHLQAVVPGKNPDQFKTAGITPNNPNANYTLHEQAYGHQANGTQYVPAYNPDVKGDVEPEIFYPSTEHHKKSQHIQDAINTYIVTFKKPANAEKNPDSMQQEAFGEVWEINGGVSPRDVSRVGQIDQNGNPLTFKMGSPPDKPGYPDYSEPDGPWTVFFPD